MLLHNLYTMLSEPLDCVVFRTLWQKQRNAHMTIWPCDCTHSSQTIHAISCMWNLGWNPNRRHCDITVSLIKKHTRTINKATWLKSFFHLENIRIKLNSSEGPAEQNRPLAVCSLIQDTAALGRADKVPSTAAQRHSWKISSSLSLRFLLSLVTAMVANCCCCCCCCSGLEEETALWDLVSGRLSDLLLLLQAASKAATLQRANRLWTSGAEWLMIPVS